MPLTHLVIKRIPGTPILPQEQEHQHLPGRYDKRESSRDTAAADPSVECYRAESAAGYHDYGASQSSYLYPDVRLQNHRVEFRVEFRVTRLSTR